MRKYYGLLLIILISACNGSETKQSFTDPIDFSAMDSSVRPQDNFFLFANGKWLKNVQIPASQSGWGSFYILYDSSLAKMNFLLDSLSHLTGTVKNSPSQQVADFYLSAMDSAGIEAFYLGHHIIVPGRTFIDLGILAKNQLPL